MDHVFDIIYLLLVIVLVRLLITFLPPSSSGIDFPKLRRDLDTALKAKGRRQSQKKK